MVEDKGLNNDCIGHMVKHYEEEKHSVGLSLCDFSFWCYECDSYVTSKKMTDF